MLRAISTFSAGRRAKWGIIALWVIVGVALSSFQPKLQEATTNENEAFLPESAESTDVNDLIGERFAEGREVDALIAYDRAEGLTPADRERISADALELSGLEAPDPAAECSNPDLIGVLAIVDPFAGPVCGAAKLGGGEPTPVPAGNAAPPSAPASSEAAPLPEGAPPVVSEDGSTALMLVRANTEDSDNILDNVEVMREVVPDPDAGDGELRAYVTGITGIIADSIEVFESIDTTLLLVTVGLVLVLLLLIYRSPIVAFVPLVVVALAYMIAAAAVYGLVQAGAFEVNGQSTSLLIVLMFGAGTDYCLLIVARYREELRRTEDKHAAMAHATERTGPAILSAGATVVASMLVLTLADFKATQTMGPVLALGVAIMLLAGLTLLPATLAMLGRTAFWPARPEYGSEQRRPLDIWSRIGHFVHDRPGLAIAACVAVLGAGCLGLLQDRGVIDFGEGFQEEPEAVEGQLLIEEELSAGQAAVTTILAPADAAEPVAAAAQEIEGVDAAVPSGISEDGELARVDVTLAFDPFSDEANDLIPVLRSDVKAAGGDEVLVGGLTAENFDTTETLQSDARLIVPLILLLIFLILCALLRAVVAPLYLVATVVLSYGFALGASNLIFTHVFNQPDGDPGLPTFAFIFLVALGVDYNIFLMSRIREEAARQETKEAVITGLERTGGVITSAGLILAGTFGALMTLPLTSLFQIGFVVAFGLLVDTFLVRTILVPAIAFKLGERNWWPSRVRHDETPPPSPITPSPPAGAS